MKQKLYIVIAQTLQAKRTMQARYRAEINHCAGNASRNAEWVKIHHARLEALCKEHMPSGSGFDNGTTLDDNNSARNRLVFNTAFHHMDDNGFYDGWTNHQVIVTPSLQFGRDIRITGKNRRDIKDYMHQVFDHALNCEVE